MHHYQPLPHAPIVLTPSQVLIGAGVVVTLIVAAVLLVLILRRTLGAGRQAKGNDSAVARPVAESASSFVTASMQGVIERLRAQEKELARLHLLAQERAQESERLTEEVTRNMPTGLLLVNATGSIGTTNPAAEEALGIRPLRYRAYKEVLGADSELTAMLTACLNDGRTFQRGEVEHLTQAGEVRRLGVTISPIYRSGRTVMVRARLSEPPFNERKVSGALCLMSDLTELAALQKQIRWKENLAALGEMSAGIAHEFKNALATISGYAQMIHGEAKPGDIRDSSGKILEQTRSLAHVVTEFLRFAKPLEICYEPVPLQTIVERVADELRENAPQCAVAFEGTFQELPGDEALIRQALVNLTRNAAEASRDSAKPPHVTIFGTIEELAGRKWQRIGVADNGPGIPEQDLLKIFLPFYTTKADGTGLGLAVVQKVALQHGGSIEARNRPGGGAEFLLWLPLRHEPVPSPMTSGAARI
jgi:signal transduction histidine kinase